MSRVGLPLIRRRDRKPPGALSMIGTNEASLVGEHGKRRPNLVAMDYLLINVKVAKAK